MRKSHYLVSATLFIALSISGFCFVPKLSDGKPVKVVSQATSTPKTSQKVVKKTVAKSLVLSEVQIANKAVLVQEFKEIPIMVEIARCESQFRQMDGDKPLKGVVNNLDTGLFQINKKHWLDIANKLGYDIDTLQGNINMAEYIYEQQGVGAWDASNGCWGKYV